MTLIERLEALRAAYENAVEKVDRMGAWDEFAEELFDAAPKLIALAKKCGELDKAWRKENLRSARPLAKIKDVVAAYRDLDAGDKGDKTCEP